MNFLLIRQKPGKEPLLLHKKYHDPYNRSLFETGHSLHTQPLVNPFKQRVFPICRMAHNGRGWPALR